MAPYFILNARSMSSGFTINIGSSPHEAEQDALGWSVLQAEASQPVRRGLARWASLWSTALPAGGAHADGLLCSNLEVRASTAERHSAALQAFAALARPLV